MPELADPPAPVIDFVTVERQRKGVAVSEELLIRYTPTFGPLRPSLGILSDWRDATGEYRRSDWYEVEVGSSPNGRAFCLHRAKEKVEKDPNHDPAYWVLIGPENRCDCKGFQSTEREGRTCKHVAALSRLVSIEAI
jgi:hypothetical protein